MQSYVYAKSTDGAMVKVGLADLMIWKTKRRQSAATSDGPITRGTSQCRTRVMQRRGGSSTLEPTAAFHEFSSPRFGAERISAAAQLGRGT